MTDNEYEFSEKQNEIILRFTKAMKFFSFVLVIAGILTILDGLFDDPINWPNFLSGVTWLLMGITFYFPTDNFQNIIEKQGTDIKELLTGFGELKQGWIIVILVLILNRIIGIYDLYHAIN